MPAVPKATKHDVALAEVHRKAAREVTIARGLIYAACIAASALPINELQGIFDPLAGETTIVDVSLVASISVVLSGVVNLVQAVKGRAQRRTIRRLRKRIEELEASVG